MLERPFRFDGAIMNRLWPPRWLMLCWPVLGLLALGRRLIPVVVMTVVWFSLIH
jgi:hypothetical protein